MLLKITASPIFDLDRDWGGIGESSMMERGGQFFGGGKNWSKGMPPVSKKLWDTWLATVPSHSNFGMNGWSPLKESFNM